MESKCFQQRWHMSVALTPRLQSGDNREGIVYDRGQSESWGLLQGEPIKGVVGVVSDFEIKVEDLEVSHKLDGGEGRT